MFSCCVAPPYMFAYCFKCLQTSADGWGCLRLLTLVLRTGLALGSGPTLVNTLLTEVWGCPSSWLAYLVELVSWRVICEVFMPTSYIVSQPNVNAGARSNAAYKSNGSLGQVRWVSTPNTPTQPTVLVWDYHTVTTLSEISRHWLRLPMCVVYMNVYINVCMFTSFQYHAPSSADICSDNASGISTLHLHPRRDPAGRGTYM